MIRRTLLFAVLLAGCEADHHGRGGGPAQLTMAILMDRTGDANRAARHYQSFKRDMVARWPWTASGSLALAWTRPVSAVDAWLEGRDA